MSESDCAECTVEWLSHTMVFGCSKAGVVLEDRFKFSIGQAWVYVMLNRLIVLAGLGQLAIVIGSLAIPRVLRWSEDVAKLRPLTRQVFWTYAGYIWTTNLCFGLISSLAADLLIDGSTLAAAVTGFIACYWAARVVIQFAYLDRSDAPRGIQFLLAEIILVTSFIFFTVTYAYATVVNLWGHRL